MQTELVTMWQSRRELLTYTRDSLSSMGASARKALGQHFLVEPKYVRIAVDSADIGQEDHVLEVGGGLGVLSIPLSTRAGKLTVIEKDKAMAGFLKTQLTDKPGVNVTHADALKIDLPDVDKCVSNIPYQISSPLLHRLLTMRVPTCVLMLQRDFAERMVLDPGSKGYSRLSLRCSVLDINLLAKVPPRAFDPCARSETD